MENINAILLNINSIGDLTNYMIQAKCELERKKHEYETVLRLGFSKVILHVRDQIDVVCEEAHRLDFEDIVSDDTFSDDGDRAEIDDDHNIDNDDINDSDLVVVSNNDLVSGGIIVDGSLIIRGHVSESSFKFFFPVLSFEFFFFNNGFFCFQSVESSSDDEDDTVGSRTSGSFNKRQRDEDDDERIVLLPPARRSNIVSTRNFLPVLFENRHFV